MNQLLKFALSFGSAMMVLFGGLVAGQGKARMIFDHSTLVKDNENIIGIDTIQNRVVYLIFSYNPEEKDSFRYTIYMLNMQDITTYSYSFVQNDYDSDALLITNGQKIAVCEKKKILIFDSDRLEKQKTFDLPEGIEMNMEENLFANFNVMFPSHTQLFFDGTNIIFVNVNPSEVITLDTETGIFTKNIPKYGARFPKSRKFSLFKGGWCSISLNDDKTVHLGINFKGRESSVHCGNEFDIDYNKIYGIVSNDTIYILYQENAKNANYLLYTHVNGKIDFRGLFEKDINITRTFLFGSCLLNQSVIEEGIIYRLYDLNGKKIKSIIDIPRKFFGREIINQIKGDYIHMINHEYYEYFNGYEKIFLPNPKKFNKFKFFDLQCFILKNNIVVTPYGVYIIEK